MAKGSGATLMAYGMFLDSFEGGTMDLRGNALTYEAVKARVLASGRFSVFEATASSLRARLFTRLERDPELERVQLEFPWIGIRRKDLEQL
jgi:hypothetical protein